jgi:hypothetical protein
LSFCISLQESEAALRGLSFSCFLYFVCSNLKTVCRVLAIAALLQGWLCAVGFVCLANVLQCAVGCRVFALNVLSLVDERNFVLGLRTTITACCCAGI